MAHWRMPSVAVCEMPESPMRPPSWLPVEAKPDAAACAQEGPLRHALLGVGFGPVAGPNRRALVPDLTEKRHRQATAGVNR
jgi:hypothetical protein